MADKDSHQILHPKRGEKIEVIPNTYMFFKVVTKDMIAPGKINFSYLDGQYVRTRRVANYGGGGNTGAGGTQSPSQANKGSK